MNYLENIENLIQDNISEIRYSEYKVKYTLVSNYYNQCMIINLSFRKSKEIIIYKKIMDIVLTIFSIKKIFIATYENKSLANA